MFNTLSPQQKLFALLVFTSSLIFGLLLIHFVRYEMRLNILITASTFALFLFSSGLVLGSKDKTDPFGWKYHLLTYLFMNAAYLLALILQQAAASFYWQQLLQALAWALLLFIHHKLISWYKHKTAAKAS